MDAGGVPDNVDLYSIATGIDAERPNYPPEAWLDREGWTAPVLVDTRDEVARAFGLPGFPYWVFVNSDGTVALRIGGRISPEELAAVLQQLR